MRTTATLLLGISAVAAGACYALASAARRVRAPAGEVSLRRTKLTRWSRRAGALAILAMVIARCAG